MGNRMIEKVELQFLRLVVGPQFKEKTTKASVNINGVLEVDYKIIKRNRLQFSDEIVVLVTGFGSGWSGIARLGYELVRNGQQVCMISLPGYGNSSNPNATYYSEAKGFEAEADVLAKFAQKVLPGKKIHWVGHSMGAAMITTLAALYPNCVSSLVLLNPAGFERRGQMEVAVKFVLNGVLHWFDFNGDPVWHELKKVLPKELSPFSQGRIKQRISEWVRSCSDCAMPYFQKMSADIPVRYITGGKDFVYPQKVCAEWIKGRQTGFVVRILPELWHNTTMFKSEKTAEAIDKFLAKK